MGISNQKLLDERSPSYAGILAGIAKGDCWVNDSIKPTLVTAYSYSVGGCGVAGTAGQKDEARRFFEETVFPQLKQKGIYEFEFSTEDDRLRKELLCIFSDRNIQSEQEYSYRKGTALDGNIPIPAGYQIKEVDRSFLKKLYNGSIQNQKMIIERLEQSWDDIDTFLENSIAYAALFENAIVGVIFGSSRYKKYITIDIETKKAHRGKGIATALTKVFMDACVKRGYVAQWDHVESNQASKALAQKCGFELFKVRPFHWFALSDSQ